jgi:hypothetical protein
MLHSRPLGSQSQHPPLSLHPDAMSSARDEPSLDGAADVHLGDAQPVDVGGALQVTVPLVGGVYALQADGLPRADVRQGGRVDSGR